MVNAVDERKLTKKLVEWAGIPFRGVLVDPDTGADVHLTLSLDACFKWLFKPVCNYFIGISSSYSDYQTKMLGFLTAWVIDCVFNETLHDRAEPSAEALAFCLAVEKLIDGEVKK